jgi:hypothetical protein
VSFVGLLRTCRYNFLYVLCAGGVPEPASMGSHTPEGYAQRARFYGISDEVRSPSLQPFCSRKLKKRNAGMSLQGRLLYSKRVAEYICFLARTTGKLQLLSDTAFVALALPYCYDGVLKEWR